MATSKDEVILSYHDSLIRTYDLELLKPPGWLNDTLIGFMFEYFERDQFSEYCGKVAYVGPSVTQCLKCVSADEVGIFLDPLNLERCQYVFFAVNDNASCESTGGSHWSLILYDREIGEFRHYDSANGSNEGAARRLCSQVSKSLGLDKNVLFTNMMCPQQKNSYDCGVYVICFVEILSQIHMLQNSDTLIDSVSAVSVAKKRTNIKDLIFSLAQRGA